MGFFGKASRWFKKTGKKIGHAAEDTYKEVLKPVGKEAFKVVKSGVKTTQGLGKNVVSATSPSSIMLYLGVGVVALMLLPKILDTSAAKEAAKRVPAPSS